MSNETELFIEVEGTYEDEGDWGSISPEEISGVAIATTDWTIETLLNQLQKQNILLNPRFQRRDALELKRKSQFIESLILGLPVPQIVLAERQDQRGTFIVLDGKQRLLCLRQFAARPTDTEFRNFRLGNLTVRTDLNGRSCEDLHTDIQFRRDLNAFENFGIRAVILRNWQTEKLLGHVFLRLNMGSKPLSPQELRQALHPGPFLNFADEASFSSSSIRDIFGTDTPDFRMRDVELIIRYFSFKYLLNRYRGNLKEFLDLSCAEFNHYWNSVESQFHEGISELDNRHRLIKIAFGNKYNYGKWAGGKFEKRFNRAIFDILIHSLGSPLLIAAIRQNPNLFVDTFKLLCSTDPRFLDSIERTTKSIESTRYRFEAWYQALSSAYSVVASAPQIGTS